MIRIIKEVPRVCRCTAFIIFLLIGLARNAAAAGIELIEHPEAEELTVPDAILAEEGFPDTENLFPEDIEEPSSNEVITEAETEPVLQNLHDEVTMNGMTIDEKIASMTTAEKAAQLFVITPEALTGVDVVTAAGETTQSAYYQFPVGGLIYMGQNLQSYEQIGSMLTSMQSFSMNRIGLPVFTCVDEEGGSVLRLGGKVDGIPYTPSMSSYGAEGDLSAIYLAGDTIGQYLHNLGFNVDFAPVADVLTNPNNTVVADRSFGSDPDMTGAMAVTFAAGLEANQVTAVYKHFPGHGSTGEDSHAGAAYTDKTLEELRSSDLVPFAQAIAAGSSMIMIGHISLPSVTGDDIPASLSYTIMTELLRKEMGFEGVIITDALNMGAVTQRYSSGEAAVTAFLAGTDLLLMPADFQSAYYAVIDAIETGRISEERLEQSLRRVFALKTSIS